MWGRPSSGRLRGRHRKKINSHHIYCALSKLKWSANGAGGGGGGEWGGGGMVTPLHPPHQVNCILIYNVYFSFQNLL